ncbi:D-alanyl-D-alanine carboxypeptidase/D-alanyl-D-alanine-endopeptidase [bacterium]|nr:D-alanyl-D-alanine carboxypeptidase/D-alanyl-D-alanine-endopeptidase [bacterium]
MQKIISLIMAFAISISAASAESINRTISGLGINKSAVSVSVKNINSGATVYSLNDRVPRLPASTLKLVTTSAAYDTLGKDYKYKTGLYKSTNNDIYLKLSGDPLLTTSDLEKLLDTAKEKNIVEPKGFYIDDTAFDDVEWGEGWQWDDELNPLMPKFSIYNINKNMAKVDISPTTPGAPAQIVVKPFYPFSFVNQLTTDPRLNNSIKIKKSDLIAPNMLNAVGTVSKKTNVMIPVFSPKMNFQLRLDDAVNARKFEYYSKITQAKMPSENIYLVDEAEHDIASMLPMIIKNSDNLIAESLFKTAGAVYAGDTGTMENSVAMLNDYISRININHEDIKVVDGSGVSKNNLMTSKFMVEFLSYKSSEEDFEDFKALLTAPGEGTLKNRMLYFKDSLRAKTGTLSDASAIAGYITTKRGNTFAFDIMINDPKTSSADKKNIEEQILRNIYLNY